MGPKMNPEVKAKWVAALRSGEYEQQTDGALKTGDKFCCLGVLCDIAAKELPEKFEWKARGRGKASTMGREESYALPPDDAVQWADLTSPNPIVSINRELVSLAECNDFRGFNFSMIADLIEEQF